MARAGWYWEYLTPTRRLIALARLLPAYIIHLTLRPYRRHIPPTPALGGMARLRARHAGASLDAWVDQMLKAYPEVAGYSPRRGSGELAIRYMRLMSGLNREYEYRLATGQTLELKELVQEPLVAKLIAEWEDFTRLHTTDPAVIDFMSGDDLVTDYASYISVTSQVGFSVNPALQADSMRLDSGGYLMRLARLIDGFNKRQSDSAALTEFFHLGMGAKFADELVDLATDHAEDRYNVLLALLSNSPGEHARIMPQLESGAPLPVTRWFECAPLTFQEFCRMFEEHYQSLRSQRLRRLCDVSMLRAAAGPKRRQSTRTQLHVTERPSQSWR